MEKKFLTKEGYEKLLEEINLLKEEKLPAVLQRLKDAIGQGDISENSEYDAAISEKDLIEARILEIEELLNNVEVVEDIKRKGKVTEIKYGSIVKIQDDKGKIFEYTMVGGGEIDPLIGKISFDSPIGLAVRNKKVGDVVKVKSPKGRYEIKILEIK